MKAPIVIHFCPSAGGNARGAADGSWHVLCKPADLRVIGRWHIWLQTYKYV